MEADEGPEEGKVTVLPVHLEAKTREQIIAIYGPMIYRAPCVMLLMRANPLRGQVGGGWDLEIETFWLFGLGPKKVEISRA